MATHTGMTPDDFAKMVKDWIATAKHRRFGLVRGRLQLAFPQARLLSSVSGESLIGKTLPLASAPGGC